MRKILSFLILICLFSCGKDSKTGQTINFKTPKTGEYFGILRSMNNHLSGFIPTGGIEISILNDHIKIKTHLDDDAIVTHVQYIHEGSRCPGMSDDKNNDGVIDALEVRENIGDVIIALDADLNNQHENSRFPKGNNFTYEEIGSIKEIDQNLNVEGKIVMIYGVDKKTILPDTIATLDTRSPQESVPIACGRIYLNPRLNR